MEKPQIVIAGGHTALAKALLECVEERDLEVSTIRATTADHLEEGLDLVSPELAKRADLVVLAMGGDVARALAEAARAAETPVIDLAGVLLDHPDAAVVWPVEDPRAASALLAHPFVSIAVGLAAPIAAVLRALAPFGLSRASVVTLESSSIGDQAGMDALSDQVRAIYTMREIEPHAFGAQLAFGTIPVIPALEAAVKEEEALDDGRAFAADDRLRAQIVRGLGGSGAERAPISVTRILVPTFSADSAALDLSFASDVDPERVKEALRAARGLHLTKGRAPAAVEALGRDDALVGRVRVEAGHVDLWIASDRLRHGSATPGALLIEQWLAARASSQSAQSPKSSES